MSSPSDQTGARSSSRPKRLRHVLLLGFAVVLVLLIGGYLAVWIWLNSYLQSDRFRNLLDRQTSHYLRAEGKYLPLHWTGSSVYSDGFSARGNPDGFFQEMRADQLRAEFNIRALWNRVLQVDQIEIQRLQMTFGQSQALPSNESSPSTQLDPISDSATSSWAPNRFDLRKVVIQETDLAWNSQGAPAEAIRKIKLVLTPEGETWNINGTGGELQYHEWPPLKIDQCRLHYGHQRLFITEARLKSGDNGTLNASGEIDFGDSSALNLLVQFNGIPITPLLPEDWRVRFRGNLMGDGKIAGQTQHPESFQASGTFSLADGRLEALPILDQIATFTRTQQFRQLTLQKVSGDFSWSQSRLDVRQFVAESEGLIRIEGQFHVEKQTVEGQFEVGLTASSLRWLPGSQSRVFTVERGGYLWAPMKLAGPIDHPREDLTPRLISAAQTEVIEGIKTEIEGVKKGLQKGTGEVLDLLAPLVK